MSGEPTEVAGAEAETDGWQGGRVEPSTTGRHARRGVARHTVVSASAHIPDYAAAADDRPFRNGHHCPSRCAAPAAAAASTPGCAPCGRATSARAAPEDDACS